MGRRIISLFFCTLLVTACIPRERLAEQLAPVHVFSGELPGTRCDRARIRLALHQTDQTFTLTENAINDMSCPTRTTKGSWILRQGNQLDSTARFYELRATDGQIYRLVLVGDDLVLADDEGTPLWLPYDSRLKKTPPNENDLQ